MTVSLVWKFSDSQEKSEIEAKLHGSVDAGSVDIDVKGTCLLLRALLLRCACQVCLLTWTLRLSCVVCRTIWKDCECTEQPNARRSFIFVLGWAHCQ